MPGVDVVLLHFNDLAARLPDKAEVNIIRALVLVSLVHGVAEPLTDVEFVAHCDVHNEAITIQICEYSSSDREVRQLRSWLKGS